MRRSVIITIAVLSLGIAVRAQEPKQADPQTTPQPAAQDARGQMMREIGLTPEQFRRIRRINMERKPLMEAAQLKLREANRLLDEAIYADEVNETEIQARLKEAQLAQAEVFRVRSTSELAIRKILTPEQLVHFRQLRERFEQARQDIEQRRIENRLKRGEQDGSSFRGGKRLRPLIKQAPPEKQQ